MEMIRRTNRQSVLILILFALLSVFIDWKKLPLSILIGGMLALLNLRGLHWGVTGLLKPESVEGARGKLVFFSIFRLLILFTILALILYLRLVNIWGLLAGLSIVFVILIKEGLREAKRL